MSESITYISLTRDDLVDIIQGTVKNTLIEMGLKANSLQSGRIYRQDMITVVGKSKFEHARRNGMLPTFKDGENNSKVWARRSDWETYLKLHTNQKI